MSKTYTRIDIKSESDLPKVQDYYTVHFIGIPENRTDCLVWTDNTIVNPSQWNRVDWYLQPIAPAKESIEPISDVEINEKAVVYTNDQCEGVVENRTYSPREIYCLIEIVWKTGAKWYRSQLQSQQVQEKEFCKCSSQRNLVYPMNSDKPHCSHCHKDIQTEPESKKEVHPVSVDAFRTAIGIIVLGEDPEGDGFLLQDDEVVLNEICEIHEKAMSNYAALKGK